MLYLSESRGVGGSIKKDPEDFVVNEITLGGIRLVEGMLYTAEEVGAGRDQNGRFTTFVLQKRNWNTIQALQALAKVCGRGTKSVGYAGMKDRVSTSTQLASIFGVVPEAVRGARFRDISVNGAWLSREGVRLGDLLGNHFGVRVSGCEASEGGVDAILRELNNRMPNYFDSQRFGMRMNNFRVGMHMLNNDLQSAAIEFLTSYSNESNEEARSARKRLADELDFGEALKYFPSYLKHERSALEYLSKNATDFGGALRRIPRGIQMMFVHSVEALIFNAVLEGMMKDGELHDARLSCGVNAYGFPDIEAAGVARPSGKEIPVANLIGYNTDAASLNGYETAVLKGLGLETSSFRIRSMPELSVKGSFRALLVPVRDLERNVSGDSLVLSFSLPSGSYATVLVNEITKNKSVSVREIAPELSPA